MSDKTSPQEVRESMRDQEDDLSLKTIKSLLKLNFPIVQFIKDKIANQKEPQADYFILLMDSYLSICELVLYLEKHFGYVCYMNLRNRIGIGAKGYDLSIEIGMHQEMEYYLQYADYVVDLRGKTYE